MNKLNSVKYSVFHTLMENFLFLLCYMACRTLVPQPRIEHRRTPGTESSVQFSCSVVSDSLWPHESQHAKPPCPSPTPGVHSDSHLSSPVMPSSHLMPCRPLLLLPPTPPNIRVFSNESTLCMRWSKYWSFSLSISPLMNTQDWSPLGWTGWISLQSKGLSRVFSNTTVQKHQFFGPQLSSQSSSHIHT